MISVTYACGCREEWARSLKPCPIHGQPPVRAFVLGHRAAELAYGVSLGPEPDRALFYPNLEASA